MPRTGPPVPPAVSPDPALEVYSLPMLCLLRVGS